MVCKLFSIVLFSGLQPADLEQLRSTETKTSSLNVVLKGELPTTYHH